MKTKLKIHQLLNMMDNAEFTISLLAHYTASGVCHSIFSENFIVENGTIEFRSTEMIVTIGNEQFSYDLNEYNPIHFIYTDIYEDPYEHFK